MVPLSWVLAPLLSHAGLTFQYHSDLGRGALSAATWEVCLRSPT
jgi:hypothetical protein